MDSEILDIINDDDQVIGQAPRSECHRNPDLLHRCTHFTLKDTKTGNILLTHRPAEKKEDGGKFCFAGEHVLAGETFEDALIRGVQEEFGFTPTTWTIIGKQKFSYDQQSELGKMFLVNWNGEMLAWDKKDFQTLHWLKPKQDEFTQYDLGPITRYWVQEILT